MIGWLPQTSRWTLVPLVAVALSAIAVLVPQRAGPVAAFVAVAPLLYGAIVLLLLPLAVLRRDWPLASGVAASALLAAVLYAPGPLPMRVTSDDPLTLLTWNLHAEPVADVGLSQAIDRTRTSSSFRKRPPTPAASFPPR